MSTTPCIQDAAAFALNSPIALKGLQMFCSFHITLGGIGFGPTFPFTFWNITDIGFSSSPPRNIVVYLCGVGVHQCRGLTLHYVPVCLAGPVAAFL